MPNTPQPGRIAPIKLPSNGVSAKSSSRSFAINIKNMAKKTSTVGANLEKLKKLPQPVKDQVNLGVAMAGGLTGIAALSSKLIDARNNRINKKGMADFARDIRSGSSGHPPKTRRLTMFGQVMFIGFAMLVDAVEIILDCFVVGAVVNRIIDIVVAIIFIIYFFFKGLSVIDDYGVFGSILGTAVGEFVPLLDVAPFFTLDAIIITNSIMAKDKARQKIIHEQALSIVKEKERQNWIEDYQEKIIEQERDAQEEDEEQTENEQEILNRRTTDQNEVGENRVGRINTPESERSTTPFNQNPQTEGRIAPPEIQKTTAPFEERPGAVGRIAPLEAQTAEAVGGTATAGAEVAGTVGRIAPLVAEAALVV